MLRARIRLAERQGLFRGNLNRLQDEAMQRLMIEEREEQFRLERDRMYYTIFASNPELARRLFDKDEDDDFDPDEVEWLTPRSAEDIEEVMELLGRTQSRTAGSQES